MKIIPFLAVIVLLACNVMSRMELRRSRDLLDKSMAAFNKEDAAFQSLAKSADTLQRQSAAVWELEHEHEAMDEELIGLGDQQVNQIMLPHIKRVHEAAQRGAAIKKGN